MKQIGIISAKGGVGKTCITAAFASIARNMILVDADTESADLRSLLAAEVINEAKIEANGPVQIDEEECIRCGLCKAICHFDAVQNNFGVYSVQVQHCQSCDLCLKACPVSAISHLEKPQNIWGTAHSRFGPLVYARLAPGEDLNGNLINIIREHARELAEQQQQHLILIDGPPAIGFAVASAISGADLALVLIEPTAGAVHDLHKAIQLTARYEVPIGCLINKCDLNPEMTEEVKQYCRINNIPLLGEIAFDPAFMEAQLAGKTVMEYEDATDELKAILQEIWAQTANLAGS
jgi:MinD superfamily P-loop ATPase